jgi:heme/copper-type cytochrome/quinol oxidase subunit 3
MTMVATEHEDIHHEGGGDGGGHHESAEQRDRKERLALWLFIGGDALFLMLELFAWFYLRALNVDGMWRGAACTTASPCTNGIGASITSEVPKASPTYTIIIAVLAVAAAAAAVAVERAAIRREPRNVVGGITLLALAAVVAALVLQSYQFVVLPFATVDGSYASLFEFFMGSTLAHVAILSFVLFGMWNRVRLGRYDEGRWHRIRLVRVFAVWIAISVCVLALVMSLFA